MIQLYNDKGFLTQQHFNIDPFQRQQKLQTTVVKMIGILPTDKPLMGKQVDPVLNRLH